MCGGAGGSREPPAPPPLSHLNRRQVADDARQPAQDATGNGRLLAYQLQERGARQSGGGELVDRDHIGGARRAVEQGQLTEEVAGGEGVLPRPAVGRTSA